MIVHGAPGNDTPGARRRGLSLRYTGDDARYDPRPGTFQFPHKPDLAAGAPMTCDLFPRVVAAATIGRMPMACSLLPTALSSLIAVISRDILAA